MTATNSALTVITASIIALISASQENMVLCARIHATANAKHAHYQMNFHAKLIAKMDTLALVVNLIAMFIAKSVLVLTIVQSVSLVIMEKDVTNTVIQIAYLVPRSRLTAIKSVGQAFTD